MEVAGSIPTTGETNKHYLQSLNTSTWSWLTEPEQSTPVDQIKGSVRDSVLTHRKKAEGHFGRDCDYNNKNEINSPNRLNNNNLV